MKILALDFGAARIGCAIGDSEIGVATPRPFFVNDREILETLTQFCAAEKIEKIVLGLPRGLRDETSQTRATRDFAKQLETQLGLKIEFVDERFTTKLAEQNLHAAGQNARAQKKLIDSEAARIILQTYFDQDQVNSDS